jgi:glutaredoxin
MIIVYTKDNCPACLNLKDQLRSGKREFTEIKIGKDITREEFMEKFPSVRTVPHMVEESAV